MERPRRCANTVIRGLTANEVRLMPDPVTKRCSKCGEVKSAADFSKDRSRRGGLSLYCRSCYARHRQRNRETERLRRRRYYKAHRAEVIEKAAEYRRQNPEKVLADKRRRYYEVERPLRAQAHRELRAVIFAHYGQNCVCCGSADRLTIDHVNGDGSDHRTEVLGSPNGNPRGFYKWLISEGFPDGYQVLCHPCNASKGRGVACRLDHGSVTPVKSPRLYSGYSRFLPPDLLARLTVAALPGETLAATIRRLLILALDASAP